MTKLEVVAMALHKETSAYKWDPNSMFTKFSIKLAGIALRTATSWDRKVKNK